MSGFMSWGWTINWAEIVVVVAVLAFLAGLGCGLLLTLARPPRKDD